MLSCLNNGQLWVEWPVVLATGLSGQIIADPFEAKDTTALYGTWDQALVSVEALHWA